MKTVLQRVTRARVTVDDEVVGEIGPGLLLLVGIETGDTETEVEVTADKILRLRCFPGATPMDQNVVDTGGSCLVVSQFTLAGSIRKGNRPSFTTAADPARAEPLYEHFVTRLQRAGMTVATGRFGAQMAVELINDGPVTLLLFAREGRIREVTHG